MATLKDKFEAATEKVVIAKSALAEAERERDIIYRQISCGKPKKQSLLSSNGEAIVSATQSNGHSATDRIEGLLKSDTAKVFSYDDFFASFPDVPKPSVRALLFKLQREGKAAKAGRGQWRAN